MCFLFIWRRAGLIRRPRSSPVFAGVADTPSLGSAAAEWIAAVLHFFSSPPPRPPPSPVRLVLQWTSPFFRPLPPPFFSRPLPQLWKWTPRYGYEGEDEVCSKFPALLEDSLLAGCLPTFCKSSLANQNSCRQSPDPEFPDKEMFMLSFFSFSFFFKRSPLR